MFCMLQGLGKMEREAHPNHRLDVLNGEFAAREATTEVIPVHLSLSTRQLPFMHLAQTESAVLEYLHCMQALHGTRSGGGCS